MTRERTIFCKQCHIGTIFVMRTLVDVANEPQDKEDLLSGKLHTFTCRVCKFSQVYDFRVLYLDTKKRMLILVVDSKEEVVEYPQGIVKTAQLRKVLTRNELIEKVLIRDAKLDDRVVEYMKLQFRIAALQRSMPVDGYLMFSGVVKDDDDKDVVQFQDVTGSSDDTFLSTPLSYYRKVARMLKPFIAQIPSNQWLRVDRDYAKKLERLVEKEVKTPRRKRGTR